MAAGRIASRCTAHEGSVRALLRHRRGHAVLTYVAVCSGPANPSVPRRQNTRGKASRRLTSKFSPALCNLSLVGRTAVLCVEWNSPWVSRLLPALFLRVRSRRLQRPPTTRSSGLAGLAGFRRKLKKRNRLASQHGRSAEVGAFILARHRRFGPGCTLWLTMVSICANIYCELRH